MAYEVIGIAGPSASGKNTAADHLADQGYLHVDTGQIVRQEALKLYGSTDQYILRQTAHELRQRLGGGALVLAAVVAYRKTPNTHKGIVISGIRAVAPAQAVKDAHGLLMYFDAPIERRFDHLLSRGRTGESKTLEEFRKYEAEELAGSLSTGQDLQGVKSMSDVEVYNNADLATFLGAVDQAVGIALTANS